MATLVVGACATAPVSEVTRFHDLSLAPGETFVTVARDQGKSESMEFGIYAALVDAAMVAHGYRLAGASQADLVVQVDYYQLESTVAVVDTRPRVGIGFGSGYGHYGGSSVSVATSFPVGDSPGPAVNIWLTVEIDRASAGKRVFEGRAHIRNDAGDFTHAVPQLIDALFQGFPGISGETIRVPQRQNIN